MYTCMCIYVSFFLLASKVDEHNFIGVLVDTYLFFKINMVAIYEEYIFCERKN